MRILVFLLFISYLCPLIRFYKNKYFYYFFISAVTDPIVYLFVTILGYTHWSLSIYLLTNLIIFTVLPDLKYKYKLGTIFFLLIFSFLDRSEVTSLIVIIFIMLLTLFYFISVLISALKKERKVIPFIIPIIIMYMVGILATYYYYANPSIMISTFVYKISLYILINIIIAILGPNTILSIERYFPLPSQILDKVFSEKELLDLGLTLRELQIYDMLKKGYRNYKIAETLFIDKRTVESHLSHIKTKLGFKYVSELRNHARRIHEKHY